MIWQPSRVNEQRTATSLPGRPCSVAAGLALVGDKWSLLVVRELMFGNHRFGQLVRNTGAPRDRLAARLTELVEAGVLERVQYTDRPPRFEYHLTASGRDLIPVINALRVWGDKWAVEEPPTVFRHTCGHELNRIAICRECGEEIKPSTVDIEVVAPGWSLSGPVYAGQGTA